MANELNQQFSKEQLAQFNASHTDAEIAAALGKTSGDDTNAGDWTTTGDGTKYPAGTAAANAGSNFAKAPISNQ